MNPISKLTDDHRAVLFDLWGMIKDLDCQSPSVDSRYIDWSIDTYQLGLVEKSNIVHDLCRMGIIKFSNKLISFPKSTLNNINKFLFE